MQSGPTCNKKLLLAPGITTSNKKLLVTKGIATRSQKLLVETTTEIPTFEVRVCESTGAYGCTP